ncbi:hypothetical protein [Paucisalibacillus sp. EB02]|uniref:hypothetical protein n=1 Tax=Paucisalibacillus sp. EB02 TaxID=1347087 RepID=UPI0004B318EF|nr:hypothetical protein [Paucisalibacillus sp. EB02]
MSLTKVSLSNVVLKQYRYKLKAYTGVFMALMVVQVIGILLSIAGGGSGSFSNNVYTLDVTVSSSSLVIVLTMIWAFMNAILMTTKSYREDDFTFVSNRLSYNLSNMVFLLTACIIGAATALLSTGVIRILFYLIHDVDIFLTLTYQVAIGDYFAGALATLLYILLAATAGYLVGMMTQFNKRLIILLPVILVGLNYVVQSNANPGFVNILKFYFMEYSFTVFLLKAIVTILIGSGLAILLSNRLEVR